MKLYLAGPDIFRPDARQWADAACALCHREGHQALIPMDGAETTAAAIYHHNLDLISQADAILANLNPFRGASPDSGTCVEIGYALALGKPVIGYAEKLVPMCERLDAIDTDADGRYRDAQGWTVENFGLALNLMLSVPVQMEEGGLECALRALSARWTVPATAGNAP
jgi:nucleoside 2-deoxyribosyltransferase